MTAVHSILVPIDGSAASLSALEHAVALATDDDEVTVDALHVIPPDDTLTPVTQGEDERAMDVAIAHAQMTLGDRLVRRTVTGDPLTEIIDAAREGIDLVVIGTHGRVGRLHALLGSVAEGVVRNAPCPVLTVRDPGGGYQSFAERRHGRSSVSEGSSATHDHGRRR
jgi:universal stress protein A